MYDAVLSETITITGHGGDAIEAYSARPLTPGPVGGVVVLHHLPGYDRQTKEFTRSLAVGGFNAVMPNRYAREAPGAEPDDAMAAARARGAIPIADDRIVGEVAGAMDYLTGLSNANGKIGVIGHCSGGRQSFLAALKEAGKTYRFRAYEGANHEFMQVDSSRYQPQGAVEAWGRKDS
jgi:carboxymethylenebutenolidase